MRFFVVINSKKLIKYMVFSLAFVVIISQFCLSGNLFRSYLTNVDYLDGTVAVNSQYEAPVGYITVSLTQGEPCEDIKILVNGDEYSSFDQKQKVIQIKTQCVVEILNNTKNNVAVSVDSVSDNLTATLNNSGVIVKNICVLTRVIFK